VVRVKFAPSPNVVTVLRLGFPDGSAFHTYHAFECAVSALIDAKGYPIPPDGKKYGPKGIVYYPGPSGQINEPSTHKVRLILFDQLADKSQQYYTTFSILKRTLTNPMRNDTLYYNSATDVLPSQRFNHSQAEAMYQQVRKWLSELRAEIP
jgi:hypothetical protein